MVIQLNLTLSSGCQQLLGMHVNLLFVKIQLRTHVESDDSCHEIQDSDTDLQKLKRQQIGTKRVERLRF